MYVGKPTTASEERGLSVLDKLSASSEETERILINLSERVLNPLASRETVC